MKSIFQMFQITNNRFYKILLVFVINVLPAAAQNEGSMGVSGTDTIFVASPTGDREPDRASILAALDLVQPDGIIQFATGTYLVGKGISVKVPGVTLLGHSDGTIIRGCDPAEMEDRKFASVNCNGIELAGSNQTVRGFTFEYGYWALHLGCCRNERIQYALPNGMSSEGSAIYNTGGGHLVEDNTFRSSNNGIRMNGDWEKPSIVRNNHFINNWHGVSINGNTVHLIDNFFSVPEPEKIPAYGFSWDAVKIGPPLPMQGVDDTYPREGSGNIVSNNQIEGSHQGISIAVYEPGTGCQNNVIRNNRIKVRRAKVLSPENFTLNHQSDLTFVGVPIALLNFPEAIGFNAAGQESYIENNLIEGNEITGAEGLGIEILSSSRNRFLNNTLEDITEREPFPGNVMDPRKDKLEWEKANGSGIYVSPGSSGNEIINNTFKNIASAAVFIEGDSNRVEVRKTDDLVRDMGTGNRRSNIKASKDSLYQSKFVDTRGIRLQYMDFGGEGLPVIFLQDFHDYFQWSYTDTNYQKFLAGFSDNYRVLAPIRRGYGKSDDTGYGYDVATQAEDLLGFMDALGIERAVLVGRLPANQDMTWIAEHHPERVIGLIYQGNPLVIPDLTDPLVREFAENAWQGACDLQEKALIIVGSRAAYRPDFLFDKNLRIKIPTIRFSVNDTINFHSRRIQNVEIYAADDNCGNVALQKYFKALAADKEKIQYISEKLRKSNLSKEVDHAMERVFNDNLQTITVDPEQEYFQPQIPHIKRFLEKLTAKMRKDN